MHFLKHRAIPLLLNLFAQQIIHFFATNLWNLDKKQ